MATVSILEFGDVDPSSGDPIYPPTTRRVGLALSAWHEIGNSDPAQSDVKAVLIYVDGAAHIRFTISNETGNEAGATDPYLAADSSTIYQFHRKTRGDRSPSNRLYVYAVAD